jgi:hypothetical protein
MAFLKANTHEAIAIRLSDLSWLSNEHVVKRNTVVSQSTKLANAGLQILRGLRDVVILIRVSRRQLWQLAFSSARGRGAFIKDTLFVTNLNLVYCLVTLE